MFSRAPRLGRLPAHMQGPPLPSAPGSSPHPAGISAASGAPRGLGLHRPTGDPCPIIPTTGRMLIPLRAGMLGTEAKHTGAPLVPVRVISFSPLGWGSRSREEREGGEGACYGSSGARGWDG